MYVHVWPGVRRDLSVRKAMVTIRSPKPGETGARPCGSVCSCTSLTGLIAYRYTKDNHIYIHHAHAYLCKTYRYIYMCVYKNIYRNK